MRNSKRSAIISRSTFHVSLISGGLLTFAATQARGNLTISATFDSTITGDPNAATIEATINTAISNIEQYIANPVTANITFAEIGTGLGQSATAFYAPTYNQYLGQLETAQTLSADDNLAIASLGNNTVDNPVNGNTSILTVGPLLRALGFGTNNGGAPDTTISFNAGLVYNSRPSRVIGKYDLQSVIAHEIDEALGIGGSGSQLNQVAAGKNTLTGPVGPLDLFRYASPGTRSYSTSTSISSYLSIDSGNTDFVHFNQSTVQNADFSDWGDGVTPADGQPNTPAQVQDAFGSPYEGNIAQAEPNIGPNELAALDVVGWNLTAAGAALEAVVSSNVVWNDASADNLWNTTSVDWNNGTSNTTFSNGAKVTFNDSNGGHYSVTLNTTVSPASVTVNNSGGNYVIGGSGGIAGTGSLSKSGSSKLTLNTVNTYSGGTNVSAGTLVAGVTGALPSGAVSITGGSLQLGMSTGLATITSLAVSGGGTFDVENNHLVINYGGGADPITTIAGYLATGYNGGAWNGAGINSSVAAVTAGYGLGYADAADSGNPAGIAAGTIEIKYTLLGDVNLDGAVNGVDFGILAANFNKSVTRWDQGDFNYDGADNGVDFGALAANFNKGASGAAVGDSALSDPAIVAFAEANGLMADVPEPACASILLVSAGALLHRRRRSR